MLSQPEGEGTFLKNGTSLRAVCDAANRVER
jgi:hypothetical protein